MANQFDAVIIGSGINSLVSGAMLAKRGWRVAVLERNERPGGAIATRTDIFPGFTVELLSSWHPLFVGGPAYAELAGDLARLGVEYLNTEDPTGVVCNAGSAILSTNVTRNEEQFRALGDLDAWNTVMSDLAAGRNWPSAFWVLIFGVPVPPNSGGGPGGNSAVAGYWPVGPNYSNLRHLGLTGLSPHRLPRRCWHLGLSITGWGPMMQQVRLSPK